MGLESCDTLSIGSSRPHYLFLAKGFERGPRETCVYDALRGWEWDGLERHDLDSPEIRLIPLQLLQFNNDGE